MIIAIIIIWLIVASPWIAGSLVVGGIASGMVKDEVSRPIGTALIGEASLVASVFVTLLIATGEAHAEYLALAVATAIVASPVFLVVALIMWGVNTATHSGSAHSGSGAGSQADFWWG